MIGQRGKKSSLESAIDEDQAHKSVGGRSLPFADTHLVPHSESADILSCVSAKPSFS